eukprot:1161043-Pelagomonas_calceolata.AAC.2
MRHWLKRAVSPIHHYWKHPAPEPGCEKYERKKERKTMLAKSGRCLLSSTWCEQEKEGKEEGVALASQRVISIVSGRLDHHDVSLDLLGNLHGKMPASQGLLLRALTIILPAIITK